MDLLRDIGLMGDDRDRPLLQEVVEVLLFTDALADPSQVEPDSDRRGWWADAVDERGTLGSTLWAYRAWPLTSETLAAIEQSAQVALASLITDSLASAVTATATRSDNRVDLAVEVTRPDGTAQLIRWPDLWAAFGG
jgi:phage gp46-like protein